MVSVKKTVYIDEEQISRFEYAAKKSFCSFSYHVNLAMQNFDFGFEDELTKKNIEKLMKLEEIICHFDVNYSKNNQNLGKIVEKLMDFNDFLTLHCKDVSKSEVKISISKLNEWLDFVEKEDKTSFRKIKPFVDFLFKNKALKSSDDKLK